MRVSNRLNVNTPSSTSTQAGQSSNATQVGRPLGEQVQRNLFGRPRPQILDEEASPELAAMLATLRSYRAKMDMLAGEPVGGLLLLSQDTIAAIDEQATIYVGAHFITSYRDRLEVLVGVIAHEVGHRPRYWQGLRDKLAPGLTQADLDLICRQEEIRADVFAGRALARLGMAAQPLADFVVQVGSQPHPHYLLGHERAQIMLEAHQGGSFRDGAARKLFPDFARATSARDFLGDF